MQLLGVILLVLAINILVRSMSLKWRNHDDCDDD